MNYVGNPIAYLGVYLVAYGIIGFAAWIDHKERRVPNWLWLAGLPLAAYSIWIRDMALDAWLLCPFLGIVLLLGFKKKMGMGDAKGLIWLSVCIGVIPAFVVWMIALTTLPRKGERLPFMVHLAIGMGLTFGLMLGWMHG